MSLDLLRSGVMVGCMISTYKQVEAMIDTLYQQQVVNNDKDCVLQSFTEATKPYYLISATEENKRLTADIIIGLYNIYDIMTKDVADVVKRKFADKSHIQCDEFFVRRCIRRAVRELVRREVKNET